MAWTHASACPKQLVCYVSGVHAGLQCADCHLLCQYLHILWIYFPLALTTSLFICLISHTGLIDPQLAGNKSNFNFWNYIWHGCSTHHKYFLQSLCETVRSNIALVMSSRIDKHLLNKWEEHKVNSSFTLSADIYWILVYLWIKANILILKKLTF